MLALIIVSAGLFSSAPAPPLVLIPEGQDPHACFVREMLATLMIQTPNLRLIRARKPEDESLDQARNNAFADFALDGRIETQKGKPNRQNLHVELSVAQQSPRSSTQEGHSSLALSRAVTAIWPPFLPKLKKPLWFGISNEDALLAACRRQPKEAYAHAGIAAGPTLRRLAPPPPKKRWGKLGERWAYAAHLKRSGQPKKAVPILRNIVARLHRGELLPRWRRPYTKGPTVLSWGGSSLIRFADGTFCALDVGTGSEKWCRTVGRAIPRLAPINGSTLLAALENDVVALHEDTGQTQWKVPLKTPFPEIAALGQTVYLAGEEELLAVDGRSGQIRWRQVLHHTVISGPVLARGRIVLGANAFVLSFDPKTGKPDRKVPVGDEISSPLSVFADKHLFFIVGSDDVFALDLEHKTTLKERVPGVLASPAILKKAIVFPGHRGTFGRFLSLFSIGEKVLLQRNLRGASEPVALGGAGGFVHAQGRPTSVIRRDDSGALKWRTRLGHPVMALGFSPPFVTVASGREVLFLEPERGRIQHRVELDETVTQIAYGPEGGAAATVGGTVYGLRAPPPGVPQAAYVTAQGALASAQLAAGASTQAARNGLAILEAEPNNVDVIALVAAAESRSKPEAAAARFRDLAMRLKRHDPLGVEATRRLNTLVGIFRWTPPEGPIEALLATHRSVVIVRLQNQILGLNPKTKKTLWTMPQSTTEAAGDALFVASGRFHRIADGTPVTEHGRRRPEHIFHDGLIFGRPPTEPKLLVREAIGHNRPLWRQTFDHDSWRVLAADARHILVQGARDEGIYHLLDQKTGRRLWMIPHATHTTKAWFSEQVILLKTELGFIGLDVASGKEQFTLKRPPVDGETIVPTQGGWLVSSNNTLSFLNARRGRITRRRVLPKDIRTFVFPAAKTPGPKDIAVALLTDGSLMAVELPRMRPRGRVNFGSIRTLTTYENQVLALEATGALLIINPAQGLRPAR